MPLLKMFRAYLDARRPRLVGTLSYEVTSHSILADHPFQVKEYLYFYTTDRGRRSVKATDSGLKRQPAAVQFLATGLLPDGATV